LRQEPVWHYASWASLWQGTGTPSLPTNWLGLLCPLLVLSSGMKIKLFLSIT
jgi:hypothetical protein